MFASKNFEELAKKLCSVLPNNMQKLESDIQQQFKEILQAAFARMDIVTREEFDVQTKVLARTREKIEELEKQVEHLSDKK